MTMWAHFQQSQSYESTECFVAHGEAVFSLLKPKIVTQLQ